MMRIAILLLFIVVIGTSKSSGQAITLIPEESITPWYNFEEWLFSNSNWGYDSYDLTNFEPFTSYGSSTLQKAPTIFLNDRLYQTHWLDQDLFNLSDIPLGLVDSVVIDTENKIINGFYSPNGSIKIYTKQEQAQLYSEFGLVNQVNDPGPFLPESEFRTPNVERVSSSVRGGIVYPDLLNTQLIFSNSIYPRTNQLVYDREINNWLFQRTRISPPGMPRLTSNPQRNEETDVLIMNRINASGIKLDLLSSYAVKNTFYQWLPLTGIEVPAEHRRLLVSAKIQPKKDVIYKATQISLSHSDSDSLQFSTVPSYGISESTLMHSSSFNIPVKTGSLQISVNNNAFNWRDEVRNENETLIDASVIANYSKDRLGKMHAVLGTHTKGFGYQKKLKKNLKANFSTFSRDLDINGYNYNQWNDGIGFANLLTTRHSVINNSRFEKTQSLLSISSHSQNKNIRWQWNIFAQHYWNFVHTDVQYSFNGLREDANSQIVYSDIKNPGIVGYRLGSRVRVSSKTILNTRVSGHLIRYGDAIFKDQMGNINRIIFSQTLNHKVHENAVVEVFFRYSSPREIADFEELGLNNGFPPTRLRPTYLLNATARTWLIDRSLVVTLTLRNLLNSTESFNTNGQYYNMSILLSVAVNI